ncbi:MFS transporter [Corynebacterium ciconiae]|uniref:MFS transporter n=1 Tax=Corynebacterium ciconiae TaxID=227319 RepID=UPI00037BC668|nr:MFS transporter [Corynebacterium ciconiae]
MNTATPCLSRRATAALLLSALLPLIDSSIVTVLLPAIATTISGSAAALPLGISGFILTATVGIIVSSTCMRRFGTRTIWQIALGGFAFASVAVALSPTVTVFLTARLVQGLACGFIMPAVHTLVVEAVGRAGMRAALTTIGVPAVIAPAFGPLFGGLLQELVGWRPLFAINLPLVLLALIFRGSLAEPQTHPAPLGIVQALPAVIGGVGLVSALNYSSYLPAPTLGAVLGASALLIVLFSLLDLHSEHPLLSVSIYRYTRFSTTMILCVLIGSVFYGSLLSTSLHIHNTLGGTTSMAGVVLGVQGGGAWIARRAMQTCFASTPAFLVMGAGLGVAGAATLGIHTISSMSWGLLVAAALRGLGLGACTLVALSASYEGVPDEQAAVVGTHTRLMLQLGGALGTALVGAWPGSSAGLGAGLAAVALAGTVLATIANRVFRRIA